MRSLLPFVTCIYETLLDLEIYKMRVRVILSPSRLSCFVSHLSHLSPLPSGARCEEGRHFATLACNTHESPVYFQSPARPPHSDPSAVLSGVPDAAVTTALQAGGGDDSVAGKAAAEAGAVGTPAAAAVAALIVAAEHPCMWEPDFDARSAEAKESGCTRSVFSALRPLSSFSSLSFPL